MRLKHKHRKILIEISTILAILLSAFGVYVGFRIALSTPNPWVAVASESMSPALEIGDLVIVQGVPASEIEEGEIIVFDMPGENIYTIHRVMAKEHLADGTFRFRTKGDATPEDPDWIPEQNVHGRVVYRVPYIGWLALDPAILIVMMVIIAIIIILWPENRKKQKKLWEGHKSKFLARAIFIFKATVIVLDAR